jgi:hypothetical protein
MAVQTPRPARRESYSSQNGGPQRLAIQVLIDHHCFHCQNTVIKTIMYTARIVRLMRHPACGESLKSGEVIQHREPGRTQSCRVEIGRW